MPALRPTTAFCAALFLTASPALAQTTVTRSETAAPGKVVRLVIAPNLKKDCSPGPTPEIRVTEAPKNGKLVTRATKLKTPASYRCPNKEAEVQALYYQSKAGFSGADAVTVEIKTAEGTVEKQDIRITVDAKAGEGKADEKKKDVGSKGTTDL
ncbi:4-aminobutyrate aminotransferase [Methylobacterium organophilum]|uniref:4-aminobutyrate aminotransferase n=1 Tax=Methylobacterium organophilum TaxID=410 RepID=A0ABQ4T3B3_METOR|nr:4-aminobutyrate aminotransferase [Methylobacterium organophilum]UMY19052.1 4-aminobutyrate aminotransferase [Methylobacterium organophilum]GJE25409.1 hypothetical protein LKMONMHP_0246 [Methylobacterium organophilum]